MNYLKKLSLAVFLTSTVISHNLMAQDITTLSEGNVEQQLDYVINESNRYQDYKVIKEAWLYRLKANVMDSLNKAKNEISSQENLLSEKNETIDTLNAELQQTYTKLETAIENKNSLSFLGIQMDKKVYNGLVFTIIALLAIGMGIFLYLFKRSNKITVSTKRELDETKEDYENYRKSSREKHERMVVKHHDEMKKIKEQAGI